MEITVTALSLTPVKGTRIREVGEIELGLDGARGDRAFYIVDADGTMVNAKRVGDLQAVRAELDPATETLALRFPDGSAAEAPVRLGPVTATTFFGAPRTGHMLDGPWSAALSAFAGIPLRLVAGGSAVDRGAAGAVSLVSRSSLERLAHAGDGTDVDPRRFRMLIEVDGIDAHAEDDWVGRELRVGPSARVRVRGHVGRCVTTTRDPDSGEVDFPTLRLLAGYRRDGIVRTEALCFGVHGEVLAAGPVRLGDQVSLVEGRVATR